MAEWLWRLTRNQMGSARVGSNPTRSDKKIYLLRETDWKHIDKLISEILNTFFCLGETIL